MEEIVEKGFKALIHEKNKHIKVLVDISASLSFQESHQKM